MRGSAWRRNPGTWSAKLKTAPQARHWSGGRSTPVQRGHARRSSAPAAGSEDGVDERSKAFDRARDDQQQPGDADKDEQGNEPPAPHRAAPDAPRAVDDRGRRDGDEGPHARDPTLTLDHEASSLARAATAAVFQ